MQGRREGSASRSEAVPGLGPRKPAKQVEAYSKYAAQATDRLTPQTPAEADLATGFQFGALNFWVTVSVPLTPSHLNQPPTK